MSNLYSLCPNRVDGIKIINPTTINQVGCGNEKKFAMAESVKMQPAIMGSFLFSFLLIHLIKSPHRNEPTTQPTSTNNQSESG